MKRPFIIEGKAYTFADYFQMKISADELMAYFGFAFKRARCRLPRTTQELERTELLRARLEESLPYVELNSEAARREILIAPVLLETIHHTHAQLKIEYTVNVSDQLQGAIDYYVQANQNFLVVEAKNEDLERGFNQMAVELIAMEQWTETTAERLYGAVSIGRVWQFGVMERAAKRITQDVTLYRVPDDLSDLLKILIGILNGE